MNLLEEVYIVAGTEIDVTNLYSDNECIKSIVAIALPVEVQPSRLEDFLEQLGTLIEEYAE